MAVGVRAAASESTTLTHACSSCSPVVSTGAGAPMYSSSTLVAGWLSWNAATASDTCAGSAPATLLPAAAAASASASARSSSALRSHQLRVCTSFVEVFSPVGRYTGAPQADMVYGAPLRRQIC